MKKRLRWDETRERRMIKGWGFKKGEIDEERGGVKKGGGDIVSLLYFVKFVKLYIVSIYTS